MIKSKNKPKGKKSKVKSKNKKNKKLKEVVKPIDTVIPISTPVGSVHFDEFLKICREPKLLQIIPEPAKKEKKSKKSKKKPKPSKKNKRTKKKNKKKISKQKVVVQPDDIPQESPNPKLFPLIKALFKSADDDALDENTLLSEFVVGQTEPLVLRHQSSIREITIIEQQANNTVEQISNLQEKIKTLMEKPKLKESEIVELENQQLLVVKLLNDFENNLARIGDIINNDKLDNPSESDIDSNKIDCINANNTEPHHMTVNKWYEFNDLAYLLSPNTSFDKGITASDGFLDMLEELKDQTTSPKNNVKRNEVFKRLKKKFSILLPPPNLDGNKEYLMWVDKKLHRDHHEMLIGTKNLKIFQCWTQLEDKYNLITALMVSLKDAIKSTSPFYYANHNTKSQFVDDQSALIQVLDELKRKTRNAFLQAGLSDYWKIMPPSMRLGSKPCFEVTIKHRNTDIDNLVPLDTQKFSFLQRNPYTACDSVSNKEPKIKPTNSKTSEIEVGNTHYN